MKRVSTVLKVLPVTLWLPMLLALGCAGRNLKTDSSESDSLQSEVSIFVMPKGEDVAFKSDMSTSANYLYFESGGTYRDIQREHMFVSEFDHGTWDQDSSGLITMHSATDVRNIESGDLTIYLSSDEIGELPDCVSTLEQFLSDRPDTSFSADEIEGISLSPSGIDISVVSFDGRVSRGALEDLLGRIREYIEADDANLFYCAAWQYGNHVFFQKIDSLKRGNAVSEYISNRLSELRQGRALPYLYFRIDKKTFSEESTKPIPFRVYPELNEFLKK